MPQREHERPLPPHANEQKTSPVSLRSAQSSQSAFPHPSHTNVSGFPLHSHSPVMMTSLAEHHRPARGVCQHFFVPRCEKRLPDRKSRVPCPRMMKRVERVKFSVSMAKPIYDYLVRESRLRGLTVSGYLSLLVDEARKR